MILNAYLRNLFEHENKIRSCNCSTGNFSSGRDSVQHEVLNETKNWEEMEFGVSLLVNMRCLVNNIPICLQEVDIIVNKFQKNTTL